MAFETKARRQPTSTSSYDDDGFVDVPGDVADPLGQALADVTHGVDGRRRAGIIAAQDAEVDQTTGVGMAPAALYRASSSCVSGRVGSWRGGGDALPEFRPLGARSRWVGGVEGRSVVSAGCSASIRMRSRIASS